MIFCLTGIGKINNTQRIEKHLKNLKSERRKRECGEREEEKRSVEEKQSMLHHGKTQIEDERDVGIGDEQGRKKKRGQ